MWPEWALTSPCAASACLDDDNKVELDGYCVCDAGHQIDTSNLLAQLCIPCPKGRYTHTARCAATHTRTLSRHKKPSLDHKAAPRVRNPGLIPFAPPLVLLGSYGLGIADAKDSPGNHTCQPQWWPPLVYAVFGLVAVTAVAVLLRRFLRGVSKRAAMEVRRVPSTCAALPLLSAEGESKATHTAQHRRDHTHLASHSHLLTLHDAWRNPNCCAGGAAEARQEGDGLDAEPPLPLRGDAVPRDGGDGASHTTHAAPIPPRLSPSSF